MTVTPEVDVELTEPLVDERPDCEPLLEAFVLLDEVLDAVEPVVADDAVAVEDWVVAVAVPGMLWAPTNPRMPRPARAARATPAVSWLISRSARVRAEILD